LIGRRVDKYEPERETICSLGLKSSSLFNRYWAVPLVFQKIYKVIKSPSRLFDNNETPEEILEQFS